MCFRWVVIFFVIIYFRSVYCFVDLSYFKTLVSSLVDDGNAECPDAVKPPKEVCDENQVMLLLAKMYIISPERVLLLVTTDIAESCKGVAETINKIDKTQIGCIPLDEDNLYIKLVKAVKFFHKSLCEGDDSSLKKKILKIGDCLPELREEFLDCEGAPDWYENRNQTIRCQTLNDIINCNYVKTAMLCGMEPAATIRGFSLELFQQALPAKPRCKIARTLPLVQDPMPASTNGLYPNCMSLLTSFIVLIKSLL